MAPSIPRLITPASLGQRLPQRGQQGGGDPDRAGREGDEEVVIHLSKTFRRCAALRRRPDNSTTMMMTASIKYPRTAGTPASRCRPPAPASSEAKSKPLAMMPSGFSRASKATAMPVKP